MLDIYHATHNSYLLTYSYISKITNLPLKILNQDDCLSTKHNIFIHFCQQASIYVLLKSKIYPGMYYYYYMID